MQTILNINFPQFFFFITFFSILIRLNKFSIDKSMKIKLQNRLTKKSEGINVLGQLLPWKCEIWKNECLIY